MLPELVEPPGGGDALAAGGLGFGILSGVLGESARYLPLAKTGERALDENCDGDEEKDMGVAGGEVSVDPNPDTNAGPCESVPPRPTSSASLFSSMALRVYRSDAVLMLPPDGVHRSLRGCIRAASRTRNRLGSNSIFSVSFFSLLPTS